MDPFDFSSNGSSSGRPSAGSRVRGRSGDIDPFETPPDYRILTFTGPSGAGKTTIIDALMRRHPEIGRVISCTTRPRRKNDPPGEYAYISAEEFDDYVRMEAFLWTSAYADYRYGTLRRSVQEALHAPHPRIMTLLPDDVAYLHRLYPRHVLSFVVTASEESIRERLLARGDSASQIERRLVCDRKWACHETFVTFPHTAIMNDRDGKQEEVVDRLIELLHAAHAIA